jgi:hypothetical protein
MIRIRTTGSVAKKNGRKWTFARRLPKQSLEAQLSVRNNDYFWINECGLIDAQR